MTKEEPERAGRDAWDALIRTLGALDTGATAGPHWQAFARLGMLLVRLEREVARLEQERNDVVCFLRALARRRKDRGLGGHALLRIVADDIERGRYGRRRRGDP